MSDLPEELFLNPVWSALETDHRHLAVACGAAARYPADIAPFAAIAEPTDTALRDLQTMMGTNEFVWVAAVGDANPAAAQLGIETSIDVLQMVLLAEVELPPAYPDIVLLNCTHAAEMVALTDVAFPGFFRRRTCEMGDYFGIRFENGHDGDLIAMGGERLKFPSYSEISGLCTHPDHRGNGYAAHLIWRVARLQRSRGNVPWLHVTSTNHNAVSLYQKLGFQTVRSIKLTKLTRL